MPKLSINDVAARRASSGDVTITFAVTLNEASPGDVTVKAGAEAFPFSRPTVAKAGADFDAKSELVTIPAGQLRAEFAVTVHAPADPADRADKAFRVTLAAANVPYSKQFGGGVILRAL